MKRRAVWWIGSVLAVMLLGGMALSTCVGGPVYYSEKYADAGPAHPNAVADIPVRDKQSEAHTCRYHAMVALYRAYGLDPQRLRIRFRLGTDKSVSNFAPEMLGTIHPDIYRVLKQDGFDASALEGDTPSRLRTLRAHLDAGHVVIVLTRAKGLHWVLASRGAGEALRVCDSLRDEAYEMDIDEFMREKLIDAILVRPGGVSSSRGSRSPR